MKADELLSKSPWEERLFQFDFTADLDDAETIEAFPPPVITIDPPLELLADEVVVQGGIVQAKFTGGVAGTTYHCTCQIITNTQMRELCGDLEVAVC